MIFIRYVSKDLTVYGDIYTGWTDWLLDNKLREKTSFASVQIEIECGFSVRERLVQIRESLPRVSSYVPPPFTSSLPSVIWAVYVEKYAFILICYKKYLLSIKARNKCK
jgi:hypothetical protein